MSDQDKRTDQDKRDDANEDTEGHALMGGPKPPGALGGGPKPPFSPDNPTGDDSKGTEDDAAEGMIPKRIIPKR